MSWEVLNLAMKACREAGIPGLLVDLEGGM
jgi:hypothetical protein